MLRKKNLSEDAKCVKNYKNKDNNKKIKNFEKRKSYKNNLLFFLL